MTVYYQFSEALCPNGHEIMVGVDGDRLAWGCLGDCTRGHFKWWRPAAYDEIDLLYGHDSKDPPPTDGMAWEPIEKLDLSAVTDGDWVCNVVMAVEKGGKEDGRFHS